MGLLRWTEEELEFLHFYAGDLPFFLLLQKFQQRWPLRSRKAITHQIRKQGLSAFTQSGSWLSLHETAQILGVDTSTIKGWVGRPELSDILEPLVNPTTNHHYISRNQWRRLARFHPKVLGGLPLDRLHALLEDYELAKTIATRYQYRRCDYHIQCVETGQIWPNCIVAATELHVANSTISRAIRKACPVRSLGLTFVALRQ